MSRRYQLMLFGSLTSSDRSGVVFCADDQRAKAAAETLLRNQPEADVVHVYDGERLVWQIVRSQDGIRSVG